MTGWAGRIVYTTGLFLRCDGIALPHLQNTRTDFLRHLHYRCQPCGLQRKVRLTAVGPGNAGDGDVTGGSKAFMDTGAGLKAMRAQRETADAAGRTKRGVDGDDRAVWMRTTDFCEEVCKVQGVNGLR